MARRANFTRYGEQTAETFYEDTGGSEVISYQFGRSTATRDEAFTDDPAPLFLSSQIDDSGRHGRGKSLDKAFLSPFALKTSVVAALAAAILFAVASVENPLTLFANAKASLIGIAASPPNTNLSRPANPSPVEARTTLVTARETPPRDAPTRDEIAAAFKAAAQQGQPEVRQPVADVATAGPAPPPAPSVRRLNADELAALMKRAKGLIALGDIAPARLLLERAADAQEATAALLLAQTYDPAVLGTPDTRSITPDPAMARAWYEKAARFGSADAQQRLAQMQN